MFDSLENAMTEGRNIYPTTLLEAYQKALTWREDGKPVAFQIRKSGGSEAAIYHTTDGRGRGGRGGRGYGRGGRSSNRYGGYSHARASEGSESEDGKSSDTSLYAKTTESTQQRSLKASTSGPKPSDVCGYCKQKGHWKRTCPLLKEADEKINNGKKSLTIFDEDNEELGLMVHEDLVAAVQAKGLDEYDVLCDNQSTVSVFWNKKMLKNIRETNKTTNLTGIGGKVAVTKVGDLPGYGEVYYHPTSPANILCFSDLNKKYKVTFNAIENKFVVDTGSTMMEFKGKNKLYVWNARECIAEGKILVTTVADMESQFTQRELNEANKAREVQKRLGYASVPDILKMMRSGAIMNLPVSQRDYENAEAIWGKDLGSLKGKSVRIQPSTVKVSPRHVDINRNIILCMDIGFIGGLPFLVSISRKVQMYMITYLKDRKTETVKQAILSHVSAYKGQRFTVSVILCDGEGAMGALKTYMEGLGVSVNPASKNEHVPEVERAIRVIKERVRAVWNTLPYKLTAVLLKRLVYYCCMCINLFPKENSIGGISPRELFTGVRSDYQRDCKVGFGEYVQVYMEESVTNTLQERTTGAISLGPAGNLQGNYLFLNLATGEMIKRRSFKVLPMPQEVINMLNERATGGRGGAMRMDNDDIEDNVQLQHMEPHQERQIAGNEIVIEVPAEHQRDQMEFVDVPINLNDEEVPEQAVREILEDNMVEGQAADNQDIVPEAAGRNEVQATHGYNLRQPRSTWRDLHADYVMVNLSIDKANKLYGAEAALSVMKEMCQLHEKDVWTAVHYENLTSQQRSRVIRSMLFLKRKRDGRLKARLVADGRMQERSASYDLSSPTVATDSLFMVAVINAKERRHVVTVDIEGAFLNAVMDREVIVEVQGQMVSVLSYKYKEYEDYERKGKLYLKLNKALYGTIEAAKLWYDTLSKYLKKDGFIHNPYDSCVFNKEVNGNQVTCTLHVDDLMISCVDKSAIDEVLAGLSKEYKRINVVEGKKLDYLGMTFDYSEEGYVTISMEDMIEEFIKEVGISEQDYASTPASSNLYQVRDDNEMLKDDERKKFHSCVALGLYMAKRGRPDILTAISFLTTRVQKCQQDDSKKLKRVAAYLNATRDLKLRLGAEGEFVLNSFVDSSFGVHSDGKGTTGAVSTLGTGSYDSASTKQTIVTKSSSEAELVGMSDRLSPVLGNKNFLEAQGQNVGPVNIHQDNRSTILMAKKGKPTTKRTRHISIRYFFIKDRIDLKEVNLVNTGTKDMLADYFTKPLQGSLFMKLRDKIMGVR
jgi:hypothetical protein